MTATGYRFKSDFVSRPFRQGKEEGLAQGRAEGRLEGRAEAILTVLSARGIEVPDSVRAQVNSCVDAYMLSHWLRRAVAVTDANRLIQVIERAVPRNAPQRAAPSPW